MESLLDRLALMGFANVEQREGATNVSQEEELAGMVSGGQKVPSLRHDLIDCGTGRSRSLSHMPDSRKSTLTAWRRR